MTVLLTGGAGYIGSHVLEQLRERSEHVLVVDDLSSGAQTRIGGTEFARIDLAAPSAVSDLQYQLRKHKIDAVIHLAAKKQVAESVGRPLHYYDQNVAGLMHLLTALRTPGPPLVVSR